MKEVVELIIEKTPVNKNVLVIALYGWGGKAGAELEELLTKNGFRKLEVIEFRAGQRENVRKELEDRLPRLLGRR